MQAHGTVTRHRVIGHDVLIDKSTSDQRYWYFVEQCETCNDETSGYVRTIRDALQSAVDDILRNHA